MATVNFTRNIQRHIDCPPMTAQGRTLHDVLDAALAANAPARDYVLDDQGALRKHIAVFINGQIVRDRQKLDEPIGDDDEIYIMQALSGG